MWRLTRSQKAPMVTDPLYVSHGTKYCGQNSCFSPKFSVCISNMAFPKMSVCCELQMHTPPKMCSIESNPNNYNGTTIMTVKVS